jgi:HK97 family phage major capsid protein
MTLGYPKSKRRWCSFAILYEGKGTQVMRKIHFLTGAAAVAAYAMLPRVDTRGCVPLDRRSRRALRGQIKNDATNIAELTKTIGEIRNKIDAKDTTLQAAINKAEEEIKTFGSTLTETKNALAKQVEEATAMQARLLAAEQSLGALKEGSNRRRAVESVGFKVANDEKLKSWIANRGGKVRIAVNTITELTSGDGGAGDLIIPTRIPGIIQPQDRTLRVRNLLPKGRTNSNSLEFVQETGFTNNAAVVAEGAQKPESSLSFDLQTAPVRTLAHFIRASVQVLDDVPQLQSYIDTRLKYGLALVEEAELLAGDGSGQHLLGLIPQATAFDTSRKKLGDTRIDIVRRAMTQLRLSEYRADGLVLHPTDWEDIELQKDANDDYIWANPRGLLGPTLWGLPVVDSTSLEEGEFLVGAFTMAAQIWDRQDAVVELSTEDADNFQKNLVTIRAEERLALTVYRPESFIYGDFDDIVSS